MKLMIASDLHGSVLSLRLCKSCKSFFASLP